MHHVTACRLPGFGLIALAAVVAATPTMAQIKAGAVVVMRRPIAPPRAKATAATPAGPRFDMADDGVVSAWQQAGGPGRVEVTTIDFNGDTAAAIVESRKYCEAMSWVRACYSSVYVHTPSRLNIYAVDSGVVVGTRASIGPSFVSSYPIAVAGNCTPG